MRIRKRLPSSSAPSSSPSLICRFPSPDPVLSTNQVHPLNGKLEAVDNTNGGDAGGGELHPSVDLPMRSTYHLPRSDPCSGYSEIRRRSSSLQVLKEDEEEIVDVNQSCAAMIIRLPKKKSLRRVHHNGNVEEEKAKAKKDERASTAGPAASASAGDADKEGCGGGAIAADVTARYDNNYNGANTPHTEKKRRRSPAAAVLMEGSRCSRVNGRGWRCCQPTLVGYSLCEHHLGKGRLRSVSGLRGQLGTSKRSATDGRNGVVPLPSTSPTQEEKRRRVPALAMAGADKMEDDEEMERKKRKRMGIVKARSMSSLLDDSSTNHSASSSTTTMPSPSHVGETTTTTAS